MARWFLFLLVWLVATPPAAAADPVVTVTSPRVEAGQLVVDVRVEDLLDAPVREALRSGLPARIQLRVEAWRHRSRLWDVQVEEAILGYRVRFDVLDEEYQIFDEGGRRLAAVTTPEEVEAWVGVETGFDLLPVEELETGLRYYVVAEAQLSPLSVEEMRDLQEWVRGNLRGGRSRLTGVSEQILGILRNTMGLGERRGLGRTAPFSSSDLERTP